MKKYIGYFFLSLAILTIGYYSYKNWFFPNQKSLWDFVPDNALIVYETKGAALIWNDLIQSGQWKNLNNIEIISKIETAVERLDSLTGKGGKLDQITRNDNILISLHQISNTELDAIFMISLDNENAQKVLANVLDSINSNNEYTLTHRTFQEEQINEVKNNSSPVTIFTFLIKDNVFTGSFTPVLIEDVVRNITTGKNFRNANENLFSISSLSNDKGNLFLNLDATLDYLRNFLNNENVFSRSLDNLFDNGFLDFTFDDKNILLNGFGFPIAQGSFLSTIASALPDESKVTSLVPSQTALLYQLNIGNGTDWKANLENYWNMNSAVAGNWSGLNGDFGFQADRFFSWINSEIALCLLESINPQKKESILFIRTTDINEALNQMNTLTERANKIYSDTLYTERYSDYIITQLKISQFPSKALGIQFKGFEEVYYMPVDEYMVFSNSIDNLKSLVVDIESENTWGKRVNQTRFLENTLQKFNMSLIVDIPKIFNLLFNEATPTLKNFLTENSKIFKTFEKASFQFRNQGEMLYTSIAIQNSGETGPADEVDFERVQTVSFQNKIISKPMVVRNHLNGSLEVMVQDSSNLLYLVNNQGDILWHDSIPNHLIGEVEQIDFFKNDKLQYLVCLGNQFKLIDRNGNEVESFQFVVPYQVLFWNLVDYDRSRNYRILVTDFQGNLYLYDKNGNSLEGWMPKTLSGRLGSQPFHLRVRGRDLIIAVQENGMVNVMNRRGEDLRGFPLDLKGRTNNSLFIEKGGDFESTVVTALTNEGELIKFNLEGKLLDRDQLFKPNPTTTFTMVVEKLGRTFVIMQQDGSRLSMLDNNGVLLFEKDYLSTTSLLGQFYDFGSGKKIYIVIDPLQEFAYIYLEDGKLVNSRPLESANQVGILYFDGLQKFHVYSTFMNNFHISGFYAQ